MWVEEWSTLLMKYSLFCAPLPHHLSGRRQQETTLSLCVTEQKVQKKFTILFTPNTVLRFFFKESTNIFIFEHHNKALEFQEILWFFFGGGEGEVSTNVMGAYFLPSPCYLEKASGFHCKSIMSSWVRNYKWQLVPR